jgi:hypothetical protein
LPPSWRTLYELTKLPDDVFYAKLDAGEIWPEMQRKDVARELANPLPVDRAAEVERTLSVLEDYARRAGLFTSSSNMLAPPACSAILNCWSSVSGGW